MDKLEFINRNLENLNRCIAENGKVELMKFTELTNKLYEAINYTHCCKSDSEQLPLECIDNMPDSKYCDNVDECVWCRGLKPLICYNLIRIRLETINYGKNNIKIHYKTLVRNDI